MEKLFEIRQKNERIQEYVMVVCKRNQIYEMITKVKFKYYIWIEMCFYSQILNFGNFFIDTRWKLKLFQLCVKYSPGNKDKIKSYLGRNR